jgi:DNA topoisomerase-1
MNNDCEETDFDIEKARQSIETGKRGKWWQRRGSKSRGFKYFDKDGRKITDEPHLARIKSLVIPPAWKYVRISPSMSSNLQALGVDTNGRIQYLYNQNSAKNRKRKNFKRLKNSASICRN